MTDYSKMTDEQLNEAIFKAKGWVSLKGRGGYASHENTVTGFRGRYFDTPNYTHDWRLAGGLLDEVLNCSLRRWGDKWCCGFYDDKGYLVNQATVHDTPQRAICEAWLAWKEINP